MTEREELEGGVTVPFTDVVESTRLSRRLEPEDVQAVMDSALRRFTSIVESSGRTVSNSAHDSAHGAGTDAGGRRRPRAAALPIVVWKTAHGFGKRKCFTDTVFGRSVASVSSNSGTPRASRS